MCIKNQMILSMFIGLLGVILLIVSVIVDEPNAPITCIGLMLMGVSVGYNIGLKI